MVENHCWIRDQIILNNLITILFGKFWLFSLDSELLEISSRQLRSVLCWALSVLQNISSLRTDPYVCETGYCPGAFKKCCFQFYYFKRFIECHWTRGLWKGLITKKASVLSKPFPGIRKLKMMRIQEKSTRVYIQTSALFSLSQGGINGTSYWHLCKNTTYLWPLKIQF